MAERLINARPAPPPPALPALSWRIETRVRSGRLAAAAAFAAAAAAVFVVHIPVLHGYFFGDDFVPLADISSRSTWGYVRDLFLLRDLTPNWRFLTGLYYLGMYRAFGLDALPFLLGSVLVHIGTAGLIFWLVRRVTGETWPAYLAAAFFGLTAAYVPTVGQVTAFNNVLAGFLLMLALVTLYEALDRDQLRWWWPASVLAFGGAIAANESAAVLAPVFALTVAWRASGRRDGWLRVVALTLPYAVLGSAALTTFGACRCTEADSMLHPGGHVFTNVWLYWGRLLYPIGLEAPGEVGRAHLAAGICVVVLCALALIRGSGLARIAVVFLALAQLPYLPIELWSAPRYVYLAAIPFSILAALYFRWLGRLVGRLHRVLPTAVALVALGVIGLYGWQTWEQEQALVTASKQWYTLTNGLDRTYPNLPDESVVYVHATPSFGVLFQCAVLPAVGEVLWGHGKVFTFLQGDLTQYRLRPGYHVYVVDQLDDRFTPAHVPIATTEDMSNKQITLLPHVRPQAQGNLCLQPSEALR